MSPMKSLQYFKPMEHKPLRSISNYALATDKLGAEYMVITKPKGLDVYISAGKIFDFKQREIHNNAVLFNFEKVMEASKNTQGVYIGVLTSTDIFFEKKIPRLYDSKPVNYTDLTFIVYDVVFPLFDSDVDYRWRYSVAEKLVGKFPACKEADIKVVKNSLELEEITARIMKEDISRTIIVYKADSKFIYGNVQFLFLNESDISSYEIKADQKFRAHIKQVKSMTDFTHEGEKYETACAITVKYNHEYIDIELPDNKVLCKSIWDFRKVLKPIPLWFTGLIIEENGKYKTLVNNFHSFIM